jgi:2-keto-4-pentenoate hydratase/2-oxohepta-3-ene-1,7-dioic acid hydratase in catechol pathway
VRFGRVNSQFGPKYCQFDGDGVCLIEGDIFSEIGDIGPPLPIEDFEVLTPVVPTTLLVVLGAFPGDRTLEEARKQPPKFAAKLTSSLIANHQTIVIPSWVEDPIYVEPEIAVVIGKHLKDVSPQGALDGIFGYTSFNDVTLLQAIRRDSDYLKAKSLDTFGVIGSWVTTELSDQAIADGLALSASVNGEVVHTGNTKFFTHSVAETVSTASQICSLNPGDIISLGTPPGPAEVARGDEVRIEVESIGDVVSVVR